MKGNKIRFSPSSLYVQLSTPHTWSRCYNTPTWSLSSMNHLNISHNAPWLEANIQVLLLLAHKKKKKKKTCFTGGRTVQVGSVRQDFSFFFFFWYFFPILVAKMTPLKTIKFPKSLTFLKKNFGKRFSVISKYFQPIFFLLWPQLAGFT